MVTIYYRRLKQIINALNKGNITDIRPYYTKIELIEKTLTQNPYTQHDNKNGQLNKIHRLRAYVLRSYQEEND